MVGLFLAFPFGCWGIYSGRRVEERSSLPLGLHFPLPGPLPCPLLPLPFPLSAGLPLPFFLARCCLGQVPGGAPFSQRSEQATACTNRMQIRN